MKGKTEMKTKEELQVLKEEIETLNKQLINLTDEELKLVTGGAAEAQRQINPDKGKVATTEYSSNPSNPSISNYQKLLDDVIEERAKLMNVEE